jgi:hypothetical protein
MRKALETKSHTISTTVINITDSTWGWTARLLLVAKRAVISARTGGVMITWSGVDPTTTLGHPIIANGWAAVELGGDIQRLRFVREAGTDSVVTVTLEE